MTEAVEAALNIEDTRAYLHTLHERLPMFTITDHPTDWPDFYVARLSLTLPKLQSMPLVIMDTSLDRLQVTMEALGLVKLTRSPGDDPGHCGDVAMTVHAPFTPEQVHALNAYQANPRMHPLHLRRRAHERRSTSTIRTSTLIRISASSLRPPRAGSARSAAIARTGRTTSWRRLRHDRRADPRPAGDLHEA